MKYVKKPIPVEAVRWDGKNSNEILKFMEGNSPVFASNGDLIIKTLEGNMNAPIGSYIIKGVEGEFYPCREDIFLKTYQPYKEKYIYELYCPYCEQKNEIKRHPQCFYDALSDTYKYRVVCPNCNKAIEVDKI